MNGLAQDVQNIVVLRSAFFFRHSNLHKQIQNSNPIKQMENCCSEEERRTWGPISYLIQAFTSLLAELDGEKSHAEVQVALLQSAPVVPGQALEPL